jgi:hypothetical protein
MMIVVPIGASGQTTESAKVRARPMKVHCEVNENDLLWAGKIVV